MCRTLAPAGEHDKLKLEVTLAAPDGRERAFSVDIKFEVNRGVIMDILVYGSPSVVFYLLSPE